MPSPPARSGDATAGAGGGTLPLPPLPPPAAAAAAGSSDEGPYVYEAHQTNANGLTDGRKGCRMC